MGNKKKTKEEWKEETRKSKKAAEKLRGSHSFSYYFFRLFFCYSIFPDRFKVFQKEEFSSKNFPQILKISTLKKFVTSFYGVFQLQFLLSPLQCCCNFSCIYSSFVALILLFFSYANFYQILFSFFLINILMQNSLIISKVNHTFLWLMNEGKKYMATLS